VQDILQHEWQDAPYVGTELSAFVSGWRIADGHLDADLSVLFRLMGLSSPADMVTDGLISYGRLMLADRPVTGADEAMPHHKAVASLDLDEIRDLLWMHRENCRTQSLFFWTAYVEKYILHDANRAVMQQWMLENCETVTTGDCVAVFFKATPAHSFPFSMMSADAQQALVPLKLATVETVGNFPADFQHNFGWLWQVIDTLIGLGQLK
jgi:hypothetical protein